MYVVNHMKLRDHQVAVIFDFFDEYLNLLDCGEEQAEDFYKNYAYVALMNWRISKGG